MGWKSTVCLPIYLVNKATDKYVVDLPSETLLSIMLKVVSTIDTLLQITLNPYFFIAIFGLWNWGGFIQNLWEQYQYN